MGGFYKDGATDPAVEQVAQDATVLDFDYADKAVDPEAGGAQSGEWQEPEVTDLEAPDNYRAGVQSEAEQARVGDEVTGIE